jgi:hypothetical protein
LPSDDHLLIIEQPKVESIFLFETLGLVMLSSLIPKSQPLKPPEKMVSEMRLFEKEFLAPDMSGRCGETVKSTEAGVSNT